MIHNAVLLVWTGSRRTGSHPLEPEVPLPRIEDFTRVLSKGLSRRALVRGTLGSGGAAVTAAGLSQAAVDALPALDEGEPVLREFVLTASEFAWELMPGTTVRAWGYNNQVPGPELRVREGDRVRVELRNALPVPTTIHWHGVHLSPEMDGPAGLNQAPVEPGQEFVYEFVATPAGSRWYHSHADPALQIPLGLYGPLIVEPRQPPKVYDREYTWMLGEWDLELTPEVAAGLAERGPRDHLLRGGELGGDLFLVNGRMHGAIPPIRLAEGERILLRLMHAGHLVHPIHTHGHSFTIVATDGNPVPELARLTKDTILVGPAERYDLEFVGANPGVWMVHCHIEHHMANGMMSVIAYDGYAPTGPAAAFFTAEPISIAGSHEHTPGAQPAPEAPASAPSDFTMEAQAMEHDVEITMVDDRFEPTTLTIAAGTTVIWVNKGHDWHSVAAFDGSFESGRIGPGERFSTRLEQPGSYQYLCKHHGLQGMIGQLTVIPTDGGGRTEN
jgi:FtsP/CotA-like multicopper oxidase with cupredoxin domain/plastocyanin